MMKFSFSSSLLLLAALSAYAAPAPETTSSEVVVKTTLDDVAEGATGIVTSVAGGVGFAKGVAVNAAAAGAEAAVSAAYGVKDTAVHTGEQVAEFVENFDAIEALDNTEESLKGGKDVVISTIFDAKRKGVEVLRTAADASGHAIGVVMDHKVQGFHNAVDAASKGYEASKEAVSEATKDITIENAGVVLSNAKEAVSDGVSTAKDAIEGAVTVLVDTIANAKVAVIEGAQNFDSKETITNAKKGIGHVVHVTASETGTFVDRLGIFDAIDSLVHKLGQMKEHVTEFFASKKEEDDQMMMEGKEDDEIEEELVKIKRHIDEEQADIERVDAIRQLWDMVRDSQSGHAIHKRSVGKHLVLRPPGFQAAWKKLRRANLLKKAKMAKKAKKLLYKKF